MAANSTKTHSTPASARILALDYLRGFFVTVIIFDHLWKFPSIWMLFTGQARLWVTAAEGFVMISGFLIGYIRGKKALKYPFREVAEKLLKRAAMLYLWMVIMSVVYIAIDWYLKDVPNIPSSPAAIGEWGEALRLTLTIEHPHLWIYFLALYAVFLALAIPVVWLFRHNKSWLVLLLSTGLYVIGITKNIEWMKWQILFFGLSVIGFHFETLRSWWSNLGARGRRKYEFSVYLAAIATVALSVITTFYPSILGEQVSRQLNSYFIIEDFGALRIIMSLLWFTAIALFFNRFINQIARLTGGVLDFIGTHSLSAYIIHGVVICVINYLLVELAISENFITNSLLGLIAIATVYGLLKIPFIARVIPR
jgi:hypothetical protein